MGGGARALGLEGEDPNSLVGDVIKPTGWEVGTSSPSQDTSG